MIEDTYFVDWVEDLIDGVVSPICEVISNEGQTDPVKIVDREYEKLEPEKQFVLLFFIAIYRDVWCQKKCKTLAKQNILEVWNALNFN